MHRTNKYIYIFIFICSLIAEYSWAWDDKVTHKDLSKFAAESSVLSKNKGDYLKKIGFDNSLDELFPWSGVSHEVFEWIREGSALEDASSFGFPIIGTTRSFNHFHNPLKPWSQAGLNDIWTGEASILWAQDGVYQQGFPKEDWSWQKIRDHYYDALTKTTDTERQACFAQTFRGLGRQMHLIQDAAQPDHVRNDAHPLDSILKRNSFGSRYFETWAKGNSRFINSIASNPILPNISFDISYNNLVPITQLVDTDQYTGTNPSTSLSIGLVEYTNTVIFSNYAIFVVKRHANTFSNEVIS